MNIFNDKKNIVFISVLLFWLNYNLVSSATTDFEMNRVCSTANFDKYKHKTGYRTAQHFAEDEGMYISSAHPFYRSLFMTREKKEQNLFIKSIAFELAIVALAGYSLINYIIFIIVWSVHKGMFRILSEEEKEERQKSKCKYCKFFLMFVSLLISLAFSGFGILFIKNFKDSINLSECGYLRFTNHGLFGVEKNFAGTYNLREAFFNYTYSFNSIENFYSRMNLFNNDINTIKNKFDDRMTEYDLLASENSVITPNPDKGKFDFIQMNYQVIYGPKSNNSTILGIINKYYNERIVPIINILEEIKVDYRYFLNNKNNYINEISKYAKYFDTMTQMYQILNNNFGRVYDDYTNKGINTVYYLTIIIYFIYPIIILILIIFVFIYVCRKQAGIFIVKYVRIIIHFLWNALFIFTTLGFILSGYIGGYRKYSYELSASFNYLISSSLIINPNSPENIFFEFANDSDVKRSTNLFGDCYNSSQSTNIANILEITDGLLYYFNKLYQDYNTLLKYVYHNNLTEDIFQYVSDNENLLNTFLYNISKTTSSETHLENDITKYFNILNKYTDFGNEETFQINCVTKMYDYWVTNKDDCPEGYIYSIDGSQEKNCLVISDNEWTEVTTEIRYLPICKMKNDGSTGEQIKKYFNRIKEYYGSNNELIIKMKAGVDILIDLYGQLIESFNTLLRIDNNTLLNFTLPFSKFANEEEEDIYNLFDCGILKQDLIDFYDIVRNKLNTISIAHLVILLLLCIFNIVSIYLLITVLYTFYRNDITRSKDKKTTRSSKDRKDDKLLTINKSNKRKSSVKDNKKGKTKSKLYVSMGKHTGSETPSSSTENLRSSNQSETSQNEEEEESEEKTGNSKSGSNQSSSKQSGSKESNSNSKSKSGSESKSESKSGKKKSEEEGEEEEEEIESGVRDDGSAMS